MKKAARNVGQAPEEIYHIYNRGVMKREIFLDKRDWARFLFLVLFLQSPDHSLHNISAAISHYIKHQMFNVSAKTISKIIDSRSVELIAFTLMPNHFHLIVKELGEGGVAKYMQRIGNAQTKYFNTKYKQSGHLFQGHYQSVHIADNDHLLYASAYVHKHLPKISYGWSSYQDYIKENRWDKLLGTSLILEQFETPQEYQQWLKECTAKEIEENIEHSMFDI